MNARALTKALRGQWHGSYGTARCPAHDDRHPSLSITERDGKLLAHCHAGCDQGAVWDALKGQGLVGHIDQDRSSRQREISTCAPRAVAAKDRTAAACQASVYVGSLFRSGSLSFAVVATRRIIYPERHLSIGKATWPREW